ncbi:MAG: urea ABC transporter permease subunit UrtB [Candidatus Rokubacteria bacterium]|nr:urea ABC transporter permease subunit UrtB [Candidatus Rokubacteria bacterium]
MALGKAVVVSLALLVLPAIPGPAAAGSAPGPGIPDLSSLPARLEAPVTQEAAILALREISDPSVGILLRALKDGALYRWKARLTVLADDGTLKDLAGQPIVDDRGQPVSPAEGQEAIALEERLFGLVQNLLDRLEVFGAEREARQSAAFKLGNSRDLSAIPVLAKALDRETDRRVRGVMQEALNRLSLSSPDAPARARAAQFLGQAWSESGLAQLRVVAAQDGDAEVKRAAQAAVRRVEVFLTWRNLTGYLFNGVSLGAVLLIMSLGLAVTFGLMGIINMAHGEMLMLGSYTAYVVQEIFAARFTAHQDYFFFVALPLSFLVAGVVGLAIESGIIRFLYGRPLETLIVTWGIGMIFQQSARLYFGDQTSVNSPSWFRGGVEVMRGLIFPWSRIFIVGLSLLALAALYLLLQRSYAGLRVRAVMQNRGMASCLGVSTRRIDALTFALGTALAGVAGCALALIGTVDPEVGKTYIVDAFMVVVLGGVGKLLGAVVASFGIGLSNKILEPSIGGTAAAIYAKVAILALVIWFLQWRPTGFFPAKGRAAEGA